MNGYIKETDTEFKTTINDLLFSIRRSDFCTQLNCNYINRKIHPLSVDIEYFIKPYPSRHGGENNSSNIKNILDSVLKTVNDKNAAILISDFIFSPGSPHDARNYLESQKREIEDGFEAKLKTFDLSAIIVQLQSGFDGSYYDKNDKPIKIRCKKRPYYICILGSTKQIQEILGSKILENLEGGYQYKLVFQPIGNPDKPDIKIVSSPTIGKFDREKIRNKIISGARPSEKGEFGFEIQVNFRNTLQNPDFYMDTSHYKLNKNYTLTGINQIPDPIYTHVLKLRTNELKEEILQIDVTIKFPEWVSNSSSLDDSSIRKDTSEQSKTFGLKYLIEGIFNAFYTPPPPSKSNIIHTINIPIEQ